MVLFSDFIISSMFSATNTSGGGPKIWARFQASKIEERTSLSNLIAPKLTPKPEAPLVIDRKFKQSYMDPA